MCVLLRGRRVSPLHLGIIHMCDWSYLYFLFGHRLYLQQYWRVFCDTYFWIKRWTLLCAALVWSSRRACNRLQRHVESPAFKQTSTKGLLSHPQTPCRAPITHSLCYGSRPYMTVYIHTHACVYTADTGCVSTRIHRFQMARRRNSHCSCRLKLSKPSVGTPCAHRSGAGIQRHTRFFPLYFTILSENRLAAL